MLVKSWQATANFTNWSMIAYDGYLCKFSLLLKVNEFCDEVVSAST